MNKLLIGALLQLSIASAATASQSPGPHEETTGEFVRGIFDSNASKGANYEEETLKDLNLSFSQYVPQKHAILSYNNAFDYIVLLEAKTNLNQEKSEILETYPNARAAIEGLRTSIEKVRKETLTPGQVAERDIFVVSLYQTLMTLEAFFE